VSQPGLVTLLELPQQCSGGGCEVGSRVTCWPLMSMVADRAATAAATTSRSRGRRRSPRQGARPPMSQARRPAAWPAPPGGSRSSPRRRRSAAAHSPGLPDPELPDPATAAHELPTTAAPAPRLCEPTPDAPPARSAVRGASRPGPRPHPTTCGPCERTTRPPPNASTPRLLVTITALLRPQNTRSQPPGQTRSTR
jgi:hypothetical protein